MPIKVYSDRIEIGAKTITTTPTGIRIGDSLAANTQQQGYISQANFTARELAFGNFVFQGSVAGFTSGGVPTDGAIQKFPFTSDTNATQIGTLGINSYNHASVGQSSSVSGYVSGGYTAPPGIRRNEITKFSFSSNQNGTDVGDLTVARSGVGGVSSSVSGYSGGGFGPTHSTVIDKFPFATDTNATNVGTLTQARVGGSGHTSLTEGYVSGGAGSAPAAVNTIDRFPLAADTNATDVGDLSTTNGSASGQSSTTHGYASGGGTIPAKLNTIDKFAFASSANASNIGNLTQARFIGAGQSSITHGYMSGGYIGPAPSINSNTIDKFPFAADTNASDVGDLSTGKYGPTGAQF